MVMRAALLLLPALSHALPSATTAARSDLGATDLWCPPGLLSYSGGGAERPPWPNYSLGFVPTSH